MIGKSLVSHGGQSLSQLLHIFQYATIMAPEYILLRHNGEELLRVVPDLYLLLQNTISNSVNSQNLGSLP